MTDRVLVVEDDELLRESLRLLLEGAGYGVAEASDGSSALAAVWDDPPDLVVLDVMLPGVDGFEVCREIRARSTLPVLMLTARTAPGDVVAGLELGADDYLTKPFEPRELIARIRAVLRRGAPRAATATVRDLRVDEAAFRAFKGGVELTLTATEMRLLVELVRGRGTALTREVLLAEVWDYDYLGDSRLVDMAVRRLRAKLGEPPDDPAYITTVRGVGYRFEDGGRHAPP